ncbi:hypothetical protein [Peribacillus sp. SCS-37]|uniref:hypothetical protein n=1 Tax=Paraperibacillus esterisolvens TaxID=3115296 RepID=UPI0039068F30
MYCPTCKTSSSEGGTFCESCGTKLVSPAEAESAASYEASVSDVPVYTNSTTQQAQPNPYLETTKKVSRMYFSYFMQVLKRPFASSQAVGAEHLLNGIITIAIYSLIIPLIMYFAFRGILNTVSDFGADFYDGPSLADQVPFTGVVIKPAFAYAIFIFLVAAACFMAVRLGRVNASFSEVIARFGSFLIPFVAILAVALVMTILKVKIFFIVLSIGFIGSVFIVPPLVIASFKRDVQEGVDAIYGTLLTYILTFIAMGIMGDMLFESLRSAFGDFTDSFF